MAIKHHKIKVFEVQIDNTKFYDEDGAVVPKSYQMCKCGHSAGKHVKSGLHPMDGYVCSVRSCTCKSFKFDRIKE